MWKNILKTNLNYVDQLVEYCKWTLVKTIRVFKLIIKDKSCCSLIWKMVNSINKKLLKI